MPTIESKKDSMDETYELMRLWCLVIGLALLGLGVGALCGQALIGIGVALIIAFLVVSWMQHV